MDDTLPDDHDCAVALAVADDHLRAAVEEWFADREYRLVAGNDADVVPDLTVVDRDGATSLAGNRRPTLLVCDDEAALADPETWARVDDVVLAPIRPAEFAGRVRRLLAGKSDADEPLARPAETLETSIAYLQELYRVTSLEDVPFEQKLGELLELGRERLGLPYGFLTRINGDTQVVVASRGDHELLQPGESCPLSEAYCRRTINQEGLLGVQDALAEGWQDDPAHETFGLRSYVGGKVHVDGELFGTLCFASSQPRAVAFSDAGRTFIELTAQWIGRELERRRRKAELKRQVDRLDEFASLVSHDLRNPLNVAMGRLDLALKAGSERRDDLESAREALSKMERLVDDLLALAREGELVSEPERTSLSTVARNAWATVESPEAELVVEDATVDADPDRLEQLFGNLFRNALEHGGADVTVTVGPHGEGGFYVADDGPGIPPEEREQAFESGFTTAENGTGFGLAIVAEIAQAHGWSVRVIDGVDGGAKFVVA